MFLYRYVQFTFFLVISVFGNIPQSQNWRNKSGSLIYKNNDNWDLEYHLEMIYIYVKSKQKH